MFPRTEHLLAWKVYLLRPPHEVETLRIDPAWHAVCAAANVDPDRYRVGIHEVRKPPHRSRPGQRSRSPPGLR
jgi:hypothetical protein